MSTTNPPRPPIEQTLVEERAKYDAMLPQWKDREGLYVVIYKSDVLGFFTDFGDALAVGYDKAGMNQSFLVRRVQQNPKPIFIRGCVA